MIKNLLFKYEGEKFKFSHLHLKLEWGDFPSFYSWFYKVTMLKSTNATGEGKIQVYFKMLTCVYS